MKEWNLIKKIVSLDLTKKCFETDNLKKSLKHEEQIPHATLEIEKMGHEIFEVKGHQFITSDGVYTIVHKDELEYAK